MSDEYSIHGRFLEGKVGEEWYRAKLERVRHQEDELFPRSETEIGSADNERTTLRVVPKAASRDRAIELVLSFESEEDREALLRKLGVEGKRRANGDVEIVWPPTDDQELRLV